MIDESFFKDIPSQVIYNGLDLNIFQPTKSSLKNKLGIPDDKPIVLGVASVWAEHRGLKHFVELSKDNTYQIVLIGIKDNHRESLPSNIITIPRTSDQKELAEYYSIADVYANPTYLETLSMTNIEAQACGTPVVTFRSGGAPETVAESTGIVVEQGNESAMHEAILQLIREGKNKYSEACVRRASDLFDMHDRYNDYFALYQNLLNNE